MYLKYFRPFPVIISNRITLREIKYTDSEQIYYAFKDNEVTKYLTWNTYKNIEEAVGFINYCIYGYNNGTCYTWAAELTHTGEVIGTISLLNVDYNRKTAQIGYSYGKEFWGRGYATLTVNMLVNFCFNVLNFKTLCARCMIENIASQMVLEKCRFVRGPAIEKEIVKNKERSVIYFYLENKNI